MTATVQHKQFLARMEALAAAAKQNAAEQAEKPDASRPSHERVLDLFRRMTGDEQRAEIQRWEELYGATVQNTLTAEEEFRGKLRAKDSSCTGDWVGVVLGTPNSFLAMPLSEDQAVTIAAWILEAFGHRVTLQRFSLEFDTYDSNSELQAFCT